MRRRRVAPPPGPRTRSPGSGTGSEDENIVKRRGRDIASWRREGCYIGHPDILTNQRTDTVILIGQLAPENTG